MASSSSNSDQEPLLQQDYASDSSSSGYDSISGKSSDPEDAASDKHVSHDRSVENDVLPETAVLGRNLGWGSAYILIMSRVIGSGIFATPGSIVQSVGSIGLTLLLWVAGAMMAWIGLAMSLEYGCMLPRSGGKHSSRFLNLLHID
jgi:amino acid permease